MLLQTMQKSKVKEKLKKDTEKYQKDNNSLSSVIESWKEISPVYFVETILNTESPISSKILTSFGIKLHGSIYGKDIQSVASISNYFDYLESINMNRMSFSMLIDSRDIIYKSIENKEITESLKKRACKLSLLVNNRIEKVKTYNLTRIIIGDHEHDNTKTFSFYCSAEKDLEDLFKFGQIKIDRSFKDFVRGEYSENNDISYFINKLSEFVLAETSHIDDDSSLVNFAYIYLEIANLGGPVDYCYADNRSSVSLWRYEY